MRAYLEIEMPKSCRECPFRRETYLLTRQLCTVNNDEEICSSIDTVDKSCPLVLVPEHGRLIDVDALIADLKRQCREVFRVNAVSPDDFWITRNEAYNERLWETWCESFYGYLQTRPTVIPEETPKEE